ncbi:MAG: hypothetical protein M1816_001200 [Peltula sp. TS41687]|nr:MAG: hypothetical protein M1816_001200 [Peltula sp. TS41687]
MMRFTNPLTLLSYASITFAIPWLEPMETPMGLMITAGFSPMPTQTPGFSGLHSIPKELRRREDLPVSWCGFIDGDTGRVLSCEGTTNTKCVSFGTAVGCCSDGAIATCSNLYTSCIDTASLCDETCRSDSKILKCPGAQQHSYCATWGIGNDYTKYDCHSGTSFSSSVALIPEYFATVNSGLLGGSALPDLAMTADPVTATDSSATTSSRRFWISITSSPAPGNSAARHASIAVIAGIAGGVILFWIIVGVLICVFCARRRKRRAANANANAVQPQQPLTQQMNQNQNQPYDGPSELHNTSQPSPYNKNTHQNGGYYSPAAPPQYTTAHGSTAGYYADLPKSNAAEVEAIPLHSRSGGGGGGGGSGGGTAALAAAGQPYQTQQLQLGPIQRAQTASPLSAPPSAVSTTPTQDHWTRYQQQQQQPPQQYHPPPRQYPNHNHPEPVYEMGVGNRF